MSRIGRKPIEIPGGVKIAQNGAELSVTGPKGTLSLTLRPEVTVAVDEDAKAVTVDTTNNGRAARAFHGMTRALIQNLIIGTTTGYTKELEVNGVGWTVQVKGRTVELKVGYADTRTVDIRDGVDVVVEGKSNKIVVSGIDKQAVGEVAAKIRAHRPPEPYNLKGIKYSDEVVIKKEGKAFAGG